MNTNCLEGFKCPQCGQDEQFRIVAQVVVLVTDNGVVDTLHGHEWDDESPVTCDACEYGGTVGHFTKEG